MGFIEYILLGILLLSAVIIVVAVVFQKSGEKGLSGTISGSSETYYGKDKSARTDKALYKWTLIASIVFALAVVIVYVIQPDYSHGYEVDAWQSIVKFSNIFK